MISADLRLLDTSAAITPVRPGQPGHDETRKALSGFRLGLSGHAVFETYSVLTRLPLPHRLSPAAASRLIAVNFPHSRQIPGSRLAELIERFVALGISGGSVYDGLVGAAAVENDATLVTLDRRAEAVYRALEVRLVMV